MPDKSYLFICKGFGNWSKGFEKELELFFINNQNLSNYKIYFDKSIKSLSLPSCFKEAIHVDNLSESFLAHSSCIIGRPSLGILTDSLSMKIPFIPVFPSSDKESLYNKKILGDLYYQNNLSFEKGIDNLRNVIGNISITMNGEQDTINFVLKDLTI